MRQTQKARYEIVGPAIYGKLIRISWKFQDNEFLIRMILLELIKGKYAF